MRQKKNLVRYCEICGNVIEGRGVERVLEGTKMVVCSNCTRFGEATKTAPPVTPIRRKKRTVVRSHAPKRRKKKVVIPSPETFFKRYEIVENYSRIIRKAREKKGWTQEELGQELNAKGSVIQKLESGRRKPTDPKFILKLERKLDIKIHKPIEEEDYSPPPTKGKNFLTLGEVVKFRGKKNED